MTALRNPVDDNDYADGPPSASVTVVEYGDYECPYCGAAHPIVKRLKAEFGDRIRLVFRDFPISQLHPNAMNAACFAAFAGEHGRFWAIHDALFENQSKLGGSLYEALAIEHELDVDRWREALDTERFVPGIRKSFDGGLRSGVNGTPTFFVNGARLVFTRDIGAELRAAIDMAAAGAS